MIGTLFMLFTTFAMNLERQAQPILLAYFAVNLVGLPFWVWLSHKIGKREAWITVQRGHAVANGLPLLACNRTGFEVAPDGGRGLAFWGSSFVAGPQGEFLARAGTDARELLIADVDLARSESVRRIWPFLRDRRIDAYDDLLKRYRD